MRKLTAGELVAAKPHEQAFQRQPRFPISVVCDDIRGLANVGTIFRLSDAARVSKLYLCGITGHPPRGETDPRPPWVAERAAREIAKTAIDTVRHVPWAYEGRAADAVRALKEHGHQIVAIEQTVGSVDYLSGSYRLPLCLILGHERQGVGDEVLSLADLVVTVPMYGMGNSLNVAACYGIVVYELLRRYRHVTPGGH